MMLLAERFAQRVHHPSSTLCPRLSLELTKLQLLHLKSFSQQKNHNELVEQAADFKGVLPFGSGTAGFQEGRFLMVVLAVKLVQPETYCMPRISLPPSLAALGSCVKEVSETEATPPVKVTTSRKETGGMWTSGSVSSCLASSVWRARVFFGSKCDGIPPRTQHVNLRIEGKPSVRHEVDLHEVVRVDAAHILEGRNLIRHPLAPHLLLLAEP